MKRTALVVTVIAALLLLAPAASQALFHSAVIDEVMSGAGEDPNVQYVEIRTLNASQNYVCHSRLTVFKCSSDGGGSQVLIDDLSNGNPQPCRADSTAGHRWLLAVGAQRDCMSFAGGKFVAGKKYLATHDPPPAACP